MDKVSGTYSIAEELIKLVFTSAEINPLTGMKSEDTYKVDKIEDNKIISITNAE